VSNIEGLERPGIPRYGDILLEVEAIARDGARKDNSSANLFELSRRLYRVAQKTHTLAASGVPAGYNALVPARLPSSAEDFYPLARMIYVPIYRECLKGRKIKYCSKDYKISVSHGRRGLVRVHEMLVLRARMRSLALDMSLDLPEVRPANHLDMVTHRHVFEPLLDIFEEELVLLEQGLPHDTIVRDLWSFKKSDLSRIALERGC
jgi:hypothetical protein